MNCMIPPLGDFIERTCFVEFDSSEMPPVVPAVARTVVTIPTAVNMLVPVYVVVS